MGLFTKLDKAVKKNTEHESDGHPRKVQEVAEKADNLANKSESRITAIESWVAVLDSKLTSSTTPSFEARHRHGAESGPTASITNVPASENSELVTETLVSSVSSTTAARQAAVATAPLSFGAPAGAGGASG